MHTLLLWQVLDGASLVPKDPPKVKRRVRIPDKPNYSLNLWSIMKNCIGRELSKIPMPVGALEGWPHWVPWGCFLVRGLELMARVKLRQPPLGVIFLMTSGKRVMNY